MIVYTTYYYVNYFFFPPLEERRVLDLHVCKTTYGETFLQQNCLLHIQDDSTSLDWQTDIIWLSAGISKIYWQNFSYCLPKSKVCQYFKWFHPAPFCSQTLLVFIFVQLLPVFNWKRIYIIEKTMYRTISNGMKKQEWHWLWYIFCSHRPSITTLLLHYSA
jgi:hypothetical protein